MKKVIEKMFGWILVSNRKKHMFVGWILSIIFLFVYGVLAALFNIDVESETGCSLITVITMLDMLCVFFCMSAVEYIQKAQGGKWDWLDLLAGVIPAVLILIAILLI